jgi:hypothetical protein
LEHTGDKMAKVSIEFLEAKAGTKPRKGQKKPARAGETGLASARGLGMSAKVSRQGGRQNIQVSHERMMRSVELFAGAGGLALGIENGGFHHETVVPCIG